MFLPSQRRRRIAPGYAAQRAGLLLNVAPRSHSYARVPRLFAELELAHGDDNALLQRNRLRTASRNRKIDTRRGCIRPALGVACAFPSSREPNAPADLIATINEGANGTIERERIVSDRIESDACQACSKVLGDAAVRNIRLVEAVVAHHQGRGKQSPIGRRVLASSVVAQPGTEFWLLASTTRLASMIEPLRELFLGPE